MSGATVDWVLGRLEELRGQFADGEMHLAELQRREAEIRDTLVRMSGAIHVLEELVVASGVFSGDTAVGASPASSA